MLKPCLLFLSQDTASQERGTLAFKILLLTTIEWEFSHSSCDISCLGSQNQNELNLTKTLDYTIPLGEFKIPPRWISDSLSVDSRVFLRGNSGFPLGGFWIPAQWILDFGFPLSEFWFSLQWIPDPLSVFQIPPPKDSGFPLEIPLSRFWILPWWITRSPSLTLTIVSRLTMLWRKQSQFYNHTASQLQQEWSTIAYA